MIGMQVVNPRGKGRCKDLGLEYCWGFALFRLDMGMRLDGFHYQSCIVRGW